MNQELRIEHYLLQLDRALAALPVSQRAEIITEIKSHIYAVLEKDPARPIDVILKDLGDAQQVAAPYLASKGITSTPSKAMGSWVRWLVIGTVATFALMIFSGMALLWYLSPLIKVDEKDGRVVLLGGMIDVNESLGKVKINGIEFNEAIRESVKVGGEEDLGTSKISVIKIPFNTAKLQITAARDRVMRWECKVVGSATPRAEVNANVMTLDLDALNIVKCSIALPSGTATEFQGVNGDVDVESPSDPLNIDLANGKVNIRPDPSRVYDFEVKVKNGMQDKFPQSASANAVKVKISVVNGVVKKNQ